MIQKLLRFHFRAPLHIGTVRLEYGSSAKMLHSDTLYAAIMATWHTLGVEEYIPKNLNQSGQDLGFSLSSLFPFFQASAKATPQYFFPKPLGLVRPKSYSDHKKVKKINYLDLPSFKAILQGQFSPEAEHIKGQYYLRDTEVAFDEKFMVSEVFARNAVARYGAEDPNTKIYYIDRLFFKGNSGMFCLAQFANKAIEQKVMGALRYLQDEGLGTDRYVGNGFFELACDADFDALNDLEESKYSLNLSLFCPTSKDSLTKMLDKKAHYDLVKRGGWVTTKPYLSFRKKSIYMFREGSIFNTTSLPGRGLRAYGKTVDLRPDEAYLPDKAKDMPPVYRVGSSLFVPIKLS